MRMRGRIGRSGDWKHKADDNPDQETGDTSAYQLLRAQRIKENLLRMQKLGIADISAQFKTDFTPFKKPVRSPREKHTSPRAIRSSSRLVRRSSRLKSLAPVHHYEETKLKEKPNKGERKRIYDPVNGKTCHQCRQKTVRDHAQCCKCNLFRGQFCGPCLRSRYGEDVEEANQNPNWVCPVCREICNCSLCRIAKGRAPTGAIFKKAVELGFRSVAHYLGQNVED